MAHIKHFENLKIQLEAIKSATNNFANDMCIGDGGFGKVYKGEIIHSNGQSMVALKRLNRAFGQGDPEFWKEIMMLSFYKHENIVSLLGYCDDCDEKILVYEFVSKKSLDLYLDKDDLNWVQRLKICIGAERGLAYLHSPSDTQLRVLHRDIKSSNILLDENWNAKISDFGLSKFGPANQQFTYLVSNPVGTIGYCDPLYVESGYLTKESDVYSFGVVLFEVLCGRLCIGNDTNKLRPLTRLVREHYDQNRTDELIFGNIKDEIHSDSLKVFVELAYQCLKGNREERPLMTQIVRVLEIALEYQCLEPNRAGRILNVNLLKEMNLKRRRRAGILNVKVLRAINVRRRNPFAACNPYVILRLSHTNLPPTNKTTVKRKRRYPVWNEEFSLYVENFDIQSLHISVKSAQSVEKHDYLGTTHLKLKDVTPEYPKTHNLLVITNFNNFHVCHLEVETVYKPFTSDRILADDEGVSTVMPKAPVGTPEGGGLLVVIIHEAKHLHTNDHCNPFVTLLFRDELKKTQTMKGNRYPEWREEFTYMLEQPPEDETLRLKVISMSFWGQEVFCQFIPKTCQNERCSAKS
uniref:probable serine/threonine-protein kinase PBL19 isoform X2 n=1 Tax=Erigeron canadensis TaxID=72917 RepID=UPI001CB99780|nr:probable serine/threonine-protein kinase PBL19 isoform X2 [Erigeron canadensis]